MEDVKPGPAGERVRSDVNEVIDMDALLRSGTTRTNCGGSSGKPVFGRCGWTVTLGSGWFGEVCVGLASLSGMVLIAGTLSGPCRRGVGSRGRGAGKHRRISFLGFIYISLLFDGSTRDYCSLYRAKTGGGGWQSNSMRCNTCAL